jgi:hypothetical protein
MVNGQPWQSNGAKQVLQRVAQHPLWTERAAWAKSGNATAWAARDRLAVGGWLGGSSPPAPPCASIPTAR